MTDCGGLLNRRGPGRKRCCHTEALHAGYHVILFTRIVLVPNYRICELVFFTRSIAESHGFIVPNLRIFLHTECHGWSRSFHTSFLFVPNYRICELVYSHGESRRVTVLLSRICEFANFSSHGESRRSRSFHTSFLFCPETCPLDPLTNGK